MNSDDNSLTPATPTSPSSQPSSAKPDRDLAVSLMRQQIDRLYDSPTTPADTTPHALENAYDRTHDETHPHDVNTEQWQQYHTAWQQYYQQYYERYYLAQAHARQQRHTAAETIAEAANQHTPFPQHSDVSTPASDGSVTKDTALSEIRADLTAKIQAHSQKVRKSRHFVPVLSALTVMAVFLFLQFESVISSQIRYYISPGSAKVQDIILDAAAPTKVSTEPRIIIPKINVDAPVVYDVATWEEAPVQAGLKRGVVHYNLPGANANPGEKGNAAFLGHSSGSVFNENPYKFIFVQLEQLSTGDKFYLNYNGTRYTYLVTSTETITPNEVNKLITPATKPTATLITCTPVGTNYKRFIVHADQISPDPNAAATAAQAPSSSSTPASISGNEPTLFERLFGF